MLTLKFAGHETNDAQLAHAKARGMIDQMDFLPLCTMISRVCVGHRNQNIAWITIDVFDNVIEQIHAYHDWIGSEKVPSCLSISWWMWSLFHARWQHRCVKWPAYFDRLRFAPHSLANRARDPKTKANHSLAAHMGWSCVLTRIRRPLGSRIQTEVLLKPRSVFLSFVRPICCDIGECWCVHDVLFLSDESLPHSLHDGIIDMYSPCVYLHDTDGSIDDHSEWTTQPVQKND